MAGRPVFICASAADAVYYQELIAALDAWEVPHQQLNASSDMVSALDPATVKAIDRAQVFLRVCTAHTPQSNAVYLATSYFQQILQRNRGKRRLVNLILDPAYPLSEEEKKTLFIATPGKSRPLWLEELAVSVGAATLTQQLSRRALFGMGAGAVLTVASASVAGTLLVRQFQSQQPPALGVQESISGNPHFNYSFYEQDPDTLGENARVFQDGATIYAQPALDFNSFPKPIGGKPFVPDPTIYRLSTTTGSKAKIRIPALPDRITDLPDRGYDTVVQSKLIGAADGILLLYTQDPNSAELAPKEGSILRAVRARDGKQLWRVMTALAGTPTIANGVVYLALQDLTNITGTTYTYETSLNAFNLQNGSQLWQSKDYGTDTTLVPAIAGGRLYIGSYLDQDHNVYCLDAKTGKKVWSYLTNGAVLGTPAVFNGTVYAGSQDTTLYALDAATGKLRWRFENVGTFEAPPLMHDGVVYAPSQDGYIYALDERTGALYWRASAIVSGNKLTVGSLALIQSVAVFRNVLFAVNQDTLFAFDTRHGVKRWQYIPVSGGEITAPIVSNGLVVIGAKNQHVYAVNP
jgi:outer membrane protein assembly factor BamB